MSNKKVIVTGASRGIGSEIARAFAEKGAYVIGTKTPASDLAFDYCNEWIPVDFSDINQVYECVNKIRIIKPDILINSAGINKISSFVDIDPQDFLKLHQINVFTPFLLCQAVIPFMLESGWGRIVNISSIWGKVGKEFRASYSASKFALDGLTLAIAAEYSHSGILANCVAPGLTDTELTRKILGDDGINQLTQFIPMRRMASPLEIAHFVVWLGSEENSYITGQNIAIDGGFSRV